MKTTKIIKINKLEKQQTYDITVKNNHNFLCNNHLIHNCDYRGSIGVILLNTGNDEFRIEQSERIGQAVLNEVRQINWVEVKSKEHLGETVRGEGGFGHTGTK